VDDPAEAGLSLVEVVVGMLLFALIAIAILPALAQGVAASSAQSSSATATRFLNALVEEARDSADCTIIPGVIGRTSTDGKGATLTSAGSLTGCTPGAAATLTLSVLEGGRTLATTTARIYVP
jgi:type II secretory pathway pseudopilin PulG